MAIITNFFTVDGAPGVDFNNPQTISVTTNPEIPASWTALGEIRQGIGGSQWVRVKASTTVTALNVVMIDEAFNANNCNWTQATGVSLQKTLGVAEFQVSVANAGDFFWAALAGRGGFLVNVQSTAAANASIFISASTPGAVTTTVNSTATNVQLFNGAINAALTGTTAAVELVFAYMRASI